MGLQNIPLVKQAAGVQFESILEPDGLTLRRSPYGGSRGNIVDLGFSSSEIEWLEAQIAAWKDAYGTKA